MMGIVGSRKFPNLELVDEFVDSLPVGTAVISGGAKGVDQRAEKRAQQRGMTVWSYRPEKIDGVWKIMRYVFRPEGSMRHVISGGYGTFASCAHARNTFIVQTLVAGSGGLSAFHDGTSRGTASVIEKARKAGILFSVTPST
jgi:hypothetical protein